ncbi:hypothetical protein PGT21_035891 [Puccinia graminis f. sp. tritici]|uniref:Uncharacterized protein n=1 Tax=Puccinia graminis f. sp. tritici TaxID=56615 RepID=A0A5B0PN34_PUCGR|nr:hypothetical protein PGT21_035891 [Puccinia graminis f. sp. tritici]
MEDFTIVESIRQTEAIETPDIVVQALKKLYSTFQMPPDNLVSDRDNKPPSQDGINAPKNVFVQVRTKFLPLLRQQLVDLLASLHISNWEKEPRPSLPDALTILCQIASTLHHLRSSTNSIPLDPSRTPEKNLRAPGGLDYSRSVDLRSKIETLLQQQICGLFQQYIQFILTWQSTDSRPISSDQEANLAHHRKEIIGMSTQAYDDIKNIIKWLKDDEFACIQGRWEGEVEFMNFILQDLIWRINVRSPQIEDFDRIQEGSSGKHSSSTASDQYEDSQHESSPPADHGEDPFLKGVRVRALAVELFKSILPLVKVTRIFFNKISNTTTSTLPFTLESKMSLVDFSGLISKAGSLPYAISELTQLLDAFQENKDLAIQQHNDLNYNDLLDDTKDQFDFVSMYFDAYVLLFDSHLVPIYPHPPSPNIFKNSVLDLIGQFHLAVRVFSYAIEVFEEAIS